MKGRLLRMLRRLSTEGFPEEDALVRAVQRHRVVYMEDLEDNAAEEIAAAVTADLIFTKHSIAPGTRACFFGESAQCASLSNYVCFPPVDILDRLEKKPPSFWQDFIKRWLLDKPVAEVIMDPVPSLNERIAKERKERQRVIAEQLGA